MTDIRERVLGKSTCTVVEKTEIMSDRQIDLNNEGNLSGLEDPVLRSHMENARENLSAFEETLKRLPRIEAVRTEFTKLMREISELVRSIDEQYMTQTERVEYAFRKGADPQKVADSYDEDTKYFQTVKKSIFQLRRKFETVGDNLLAVTDASEQSRRQSRELLQLAAKHERSRAQNAVTTPAEPTAFATEPTEPTTTTTAEPTAEPAGLRRRNPVGHEHRPSPEE